MTLFGKHVNVSCGTCFRCMPVADICMIEPWADASDTLLSISGSVDDFEIGPLKVSGLDSAKQATLQVSVGKDIRHLLVDGAVRLYAETCALHLLLDTQLSPEISFKVYVLLDFSFGPGPDPCQWLTPFSASEFEPTKLLTFEVDVTLICS